MNNMDAMGAAETSAKEIIRKRLHGMANVQPAQPVSSEDLQAAVLPSIDNLVQHFVAQFRAMGGKCKLCNDVSHMMNCMVQLLKNQNYNQIFCNSPFLVDLLQQQQINASSSYSSDFPPQVAVLYAEQLIARSGSFVFSQQYSIYPSCKNIAPDLLIVGSVSRLVPDLHDALDVMASDESNQKSENLGGMLEIVTPSLPQLLNGEEVYTKENPRMILLLSNQ
ncbi:MAG: hypothetical protein MJZ76_05250 [Bacteroidales bacterium]|nr:hypothetical protein [Bacteroidales bacterium]